ncbi:MAG: hypothetical protein QMC36_05320 [Patescibacteria group bacterium]
MDSDRNKGASAFSSNATVSIRGTGGVTTERKPKNVLVPQGEYLPYAVTAAAVAIGKRAWVDSF